VANEGIVDANYDGRALADRFDTQTLVEDLTLLLVYVTSWRTDGPASLGALCSWKGYDFGILDALADKGYIVSGSRRSKSVALTQDGIREASKIEASLLDACGERYKRRDAEARLKARRDTEFFCEICQHPVTAPYWYYEPFEQFCQGKITRERIVELLRRYHRRHWHTDAEKISRDRFFHDLSKGMDFDEAAKEAREFAQRMVPTELESNMKNDR
jgi:hypothetical protein